MELMGSWMLFPGRKAKAAGSRMGEMEVEDLVMAAPSREAISLFTILPKTGPTAMGLISSTEVRMPLFLGIGVTVLCFSGGGIS